MKGESGVEPVSLTTGDILTLKGAARFARTAETTVARWARRYGIGRQLGPNAPWKISGPGLRMVMAADSVALEAFRARDLTNDRVRQYLVADREVANG